MLSGKLHNFLNKKNFQLDLFLFIDDQLIKNKSQIIPLKRCNNLIQLKQVSNKNGNAPITVINYYIEENNLKCYTNEKRKSTELYMNINNHIDYNKIHDNKLSSVIEASNLDLTTKIDKNSPFTIKTDSEEEAPYYCIRKPISIGHKLVKNEINI